MMMIMIMTYEEVWKT